MIENELGVSFCLRDVRILIAFLSLMNYDYSWFGLNAFCMRPLQNYYRGYLLGHTHYVRIIRIPFSRLTLYRVVTHVYYYTAVCLEML